MDVHKLFAFHGFNLDSRGTVVVLRGVPGSGKSRLVRLLKYPVHVVSADDFFLANDKYEFDHLLLPQAHGFCLRNFVQAIQDGQPLIVVDNTNTTIVEIAPYMALAAAYSYEARVVTLECDPKIAAARNSHGVPLSTCLNMAKRLKAAELLPGWEHTTIPQDFQVTPS